MNEYARRFLRFWSEFLIGDDWTLGAGVVVVLALAAAAEISPIEPFAWLLAAVGVLLVLAVSVWRAARSGAA